MQVTAEEVNEELQAAADSQSFMKQLTRLRERVRAVGTAQKIFDLHVELGRRLAKRHVTHCSWLPKQKNPQIVYAIKLWKVHIWIYI